MKRDHPYSGRWVAKLQGKIVGQGGTPRQALRAAKVSRLKETPDVEYMPSSQVVTLPQEVQRIVSALPEGQEIYLVGGAVRDLLLGRATNDFDFAVPGPAIPLARRVAQKLGADFYPLDSERDAGRLLVQGSGGKRATFDFVGFQGKDIDADLAARDFTINAMAIDLRNPGALLDPFGGAQDLLAKVVKAVSPSVFENDAVRILRAVRMAAAFGMKIEKETRERMRKAVSDLQLVSAERLRDELFRLLLAPKPAASIRALDILGMLPCVLPELMPLKGIEQSPPHAFDVWEHTLRVVDQLERVANSLTDAPADKSSGDLVTSLINLSLGRYRRQFTEHLEGELVAGRPRLGLLFFAALLHDAGKAGTRSLGNDGRIHFYEHEARGTEMAQARAAAFNLSNDEKNLLEILIGQHMRPMQLTLTGEAPMRRAIYRFFRATGEAGVDICLLSLADFLGKFAGEIPGEELKRHLETLRLLLEPYYERHDAEVDPKPFLTGDDLMSEFDLTPGPRVGALLAELHEAQAAGEIASRAAALDFARSSLERKR
ncbi:MAG: HD domain-containing protein [Anaerolineales bacterium]